MWKIFVLLMMDQQISYYHLTLKMTTAKVAEMSVNNNKNSPSQDYTNLDNQHLQTSKYFSKINIDFEFLKYIISPMVTPLRNLHGKTYTMITKHGLILHT